MKENIKNLAYALLRDKNGMDEISYNLLCYLALDAGCTREDIAVWARQVDMIDGRILIPIEEV
jgi:hypothetical protein